MLWTLPLGLCWGFHCRTGRGPLFHWPHGLQGVTLNGPVSALENGHQFFVLRQGSAIGSRSSLYRARGVLLCLLLFTDPGQPLPPGQDARKVHPVGDLVPPHQHPGPMAAKYGIRCVFQVAVDVVTRCSDDFLRVVAGGIPSRQARKLAPPLGIGGDFPGIPPQRCHWRLASDHHLFPLGDRRFKLGAKPGHIRQSPAHRLLGQPQGKLVPGFQQHTIPPGLGCPQSLAHCPVGGLTEVAALGVLDVGPACRQSDLHVGERGAGQGAQVGLFRQMGQDQPLPAARQFVLPTGGGDLHAASPGGRLQ